jgi:arylsulfatase
MENPMRNIMALLLILTLYAAHTQSRPNFVIFIGDDISPDFGCYGHPTIKTPNVDALAARGMRFTNAYLTAPSCSPSRTSLITGRYPHNTGGPELHMKKNPHLAELPQFPHELRKAGYYTALAGKAHFNGDASKSFDRMYSPLDATRPDDKSGMANWMKALKERPKDKPFLMWLAAIDAHRPWDMDLAEGPHGAEDAVVPPYLVDAERTRKDLALYYNEVHRFDRKIGEVVAELKAQGVYENTVIIVMADNGRPFPRDKTWIHDGGIKTPLVVHWPGTTAKAAVSSSLVSSIDIAPTVLAMAGLPIPKTVQGVSFVPLIGDPKTTTRDVVFAERNWHVYRHHDRLVRWRNYTYIKNSTPDFVGFNSMQKIHQRPESIEGTTASTDLIEGFWNGTLTEAQAFALHAPCPTEALFDVSKDPHQVNNLSGDPRYAEQLQTMRDLLACWAKETGDTVPPLDRMTPDRSDRKTGVAIQKGGRPSGGVFPGQETKAWTIHAPGPVRLGGHP